MTAPILSIITICRNEPFITDTCDSIIDQTNQNFEWIIIDGASTDGTLEKLNQYKHRADVFISEADNGIFSAQNKGARHARGKYLLFMNGGDTIYDKNTIDKVMPYLETDAECVFYGDTYCRFNTPEKCFVKTYPDILDKDFFLGATIGHQSAFIHRNLIEKYGPYREDFKIVSDKEKWLKYLDAGVMFRHMAFPCARFRMDGVSSTPSERLKAEDKRLLAEYFPISTLQNSALPYLQELFQND